MVDRKKKPDKAVKAERAIKEARPQSTPEARETQLIGLAINLAEKQLRDGSASPSVINHFLKLATKREAIEREIMESQKSLIQAKTQNIVKEKEQEELTKAAIDAMKNYQSRS